MNKQISTLQKQLDEFTICGWNKTFGASIAVKWDLTLQQIETALSIVSSLNKVDGVHWQTYDKVRVQLKCRKILILNPEHVF